MAIRYEDIAPRVRRVTIDLAIPDTAAERAAKSAPKKVLVRLADGETLVERRTEVEAKPRFDRNAYHKAYMKTYMRAYRLRKRPT